VHQDFGIDRPRDACLPVSTNGRRGVLNPDLALGDRDADVVAVRRRTENWVAHGHHAPCRPACTIKGRAGSFATSKKCFASVQIDASFLGFPIATRMRLSVLSVTWETVGQWNRVHGGRLGSSKRVPDKRAGRVDIEAADEGERSTRPPRPGTLPLRRPPRLSRGRGGIAHPSVSAAVGCVFRRLG